jgi:multimeric flavodoxin WrbA
MANKKILAIVGSPRKKETWGIARQFGQEISAKIDVEFETVHLKDYNILPCRGCFLCLTKGEEFCPHHDDLKLLVEKMMIADGVIVASPNYAMQVSALMKNFLDRIAYAFHRPCFFHKRFMPIITQGAIGGKDIIRYLENVARYTGFIYVPGIVATTVSPRTASEQRKIDRQVEAGVQRFVQALNGNESPKPSISSVAIFRLVRSLYRTTPDDSLKDVHYYRDNGWFESGYFYPIRLGVVRTLTGVLIDRLGKGLALKRKRELDEIKQGKSTA